MNLYLDDDITKGALIARLRNEVHDVVLPSDLGFAGAADPRHMINAVRNACVLLTKNYKDFADLHDLVTESGGAHSGLLLIRLDNDPKRDMKDRDIARSLANLEKSGVAVANEMHILNHWR